MGTLTGKVALVTGASRGVGKGIALGLGEAGATVYITGRTVREGEAAVPLAGTVAATAQAVTEIGGTGIPVACDHRNDARVAAVFALIAGEQTRLDVLVNSAWAGYEGYVTGKHMPPGFSFWKKPMSYWDDNLDGLRWTYIASWHAAQRMVEQR
ncbi:MAG: SDR family NAD(P)-dependent oxidoreductase, partial [Chloroflexota bacterium]